MSLLDRAIIRPGIPDRRTYTHTPLLRSPSSRRRCCHAKVKLDDEEQDQSTSHKGFNIRVPTMPKLGDIEAARRLLESAFQNLSFDMPKLPIDSALQGLPFGISKLSTPVRVLVLDITGFVVTKLKKPHKKALEESTILDEQYPRCAWPRMVKGSQVAVVANIGLLENPKEQEASYQIPVGPHCAWPRATGQVTQASGLASFPDVPYPRSAWPRGSIPASHGVLAGQQLNKFFNTKAEEPSPCIIEGGPRCAWPRKSIPAKQGYHAAANTTNAKELELSQGADANGGKVRPVECDAATELPRRMLATSVCLTVMNQLAKGSIVTPIFDWCSLLPAGSLDIPEGEGAAMDLGRRTLLVFIKS